MKECPRCGVQVDELLPIRADIIVKLQANGEPNPGAVCGGCEKDIYRDLVSSGTGVLAAHERAKAQYRAQLWRGRMALIKKGRMAMNRKLLNDAANSFEKYLKVLELIFEIPPGERLTPAHFRNHARTNELTLVASVYWDLLKIYDSHSNLHGRMDQVAQQLAQFVQYTPIYADIIKKAQIFSRSARNPGAVRTFLKSSNKERPRCFIATSAFENPMAEEVQTLRQFRDDVLKKTFLGRKFVYFYYRTSPPIAEFLDSRPALRSFTRLVLRLLIICVK